MVFGVRLQRAMDPPLLSRQHAAKKLARPDGTKQRVRPPGPVRHAGAIRAASPSLCAPRSTEPSGFTFVFQVAHGHAGLAKCQPVSFLTSNANSSMQGGQGLEISAGSLDLS